MHRHTWAPVLRIAHEWSWDLLLMASYAVLGTGAVGGLYGGLLARAGFDVHFLLRNDFDYVRENGLKVETPLGDFHLPRVHAYRQPGDMPTVDVVLVTWKSTSNADLEQALAPLIKSNTSVL